MYPNNLLNSSLHHINSDKFPSSLCSCGEDVQTAKHLLLQCKLVEDALKAEAHDLLVKAVGEEEAAMDCSITILNASRNKKFLEVVHQIINSQIDTLHVNVEI